MDAIEFAAVLLELIIPIHADFVICLSFFHACAVKMVRR
jgi:hypothetical protein